MRTRNSSHCSADRYCVCFGGLPVVFRIRDATRTAGVTTARSPHRYPGGAVERRAMVRRAVEETAVFDIPEWGAIIVGQGEACHWRLNWGAAGLFGEETSRESAAVLLNVQCRFWWRRNWRGTE